MQRLVKFSSQLRVLLGVVVLNELIYLCFSGFFSFSAASHSSFVATLTGLAQTSPLGPVQYGLTLFSGIPVLASCLCIVSFLVSGIGMILGRGKRLSTLLASVIFSVLFLSHAGDKTTWLFEFAMPAGFSFLLLFFYCRAGFGAEAVRQSDFNQTSWVSFLGVSVPFCAFVYWINYMSLSDSMVGAQIGAFVAIGSFVLLVLNRLFSGKQVSGSVTASGEHALMSYAAIMIGVMLMTQVQMDSLLGWFTVPGYIQLINHYDQYSSAPAFIKVFMPLVKEHAQLFISAQMVVEAFLAFCLVARLFQPLASLASFGLFLSLSVMEYGVVNAASLGVHQGSVWELMLTALVMGVVAYHQWWTLFTRDERIDWYAARPLFPNHSTMQRFWMLVAWTMGLVLLIATSHNLHQFEEHFLIVAGLGLGTALLVLHYVDELRSRLHRR